MIEVKVTILNIGQRADKTKAILKRFQQEAGELVENAVKNVLGHDNIYTLTENYQQAKPKRPNFVRVPGKDSDQPLILSGAMYNALNFHVEGDLAVIQVEEGEALAKNGDDYAEVWEEKVEYLEKGLAEVEEFLPELLLQIVVEEMGL